MTAQLINARAYVGSQHGRVCGDERAADPLHGTGIDAKSGGDLAHAFGTSRRVQSLADSVFRLGRYRRPAEPLALAPRLS